MHAKALCFCVFDKPKKVYKNLIEHISHPVLRMYVTLKEINLTHQNNPCKRKKGKKKKNGQNKMEIILLEKCIIQNAQFY